MVTHSTHSIKSKNKYNDKITRKKAETATYRPH